MDLRLDSLLARLLIGTCIPLVLFVAVVLVALISIGRLHEALEVEQRVQEVLTLLHQQDEDLEGMRLETRGMVLELPHTSQENLEAIRRRFRDRTAAILDLVRDGAQVERLRTLRAMEQHWSRLNDEALGKLRRHPGQTREEMVRLTREQFDRTTPVTEKLETAIANLVGAESAVLNRRRDRTNAEARQSVWLIGITASVALVLSLLIALRVARSVTRPVDRLREAAGQLVAGRFCVVPPAGPAEIVELIGRFNHMGLTLAERASSLERQAGRYEHYLGATAQLLWMTDAAGRVVADLPTWRAYTGQSAEQVLGAGWLEAVHPEDRALTETVWQRSVESGSGFEHECRLRSAAGDCRPFACRAVPIPNPDGSVREWLGTCTDVTERKQEAALHRAKEAAEAASRTKSEFLAKMSHELRTPLNAVIGMSKMLTTQRFGALNAKQADYLKDITQAGEHLLALINDVLDIAKVESGRMDLHTAPFPAREAVASLAGTLRPMAEERGLTLRVSPPEPDGSLASDQGRFKQVLYNLLSNAIKFTPRGGSVTLSCQWVASADRAAPTAVEAEAAALRVSVADTGVGIAAADQEVIWDEFRQLKPNPNVAPQGTGLGLALTRRLVALLGGAVWLESEPGKGSTFTFVVPRRLPERPAAEPPTTGAEVVGGPRPLALVIEDHGPTRKLLMDWLSEDGLATASAADGEIGVDLARRLLPQLIVLDLFLPSRDGWQVLTDLKSDPATAAIPVVIVSMMEDRYPAPGLDVQEFFVKPVEREAFLRRLRELRPELFTDGRGLTALVVDDDPAARKLLRDMLEAGGAAVVEAADGAEALTRLTAGLPDVLVLDLLMPGTDGFAVVEAVRSRPEWERLPILVVTAKDLATDDRERLNGRIQALVAKGRLTPERLQEQLRRAGLRAGAS